jgi:hypothetical protein
VAQRIQIAHRRTHRSNRYLLTGDGIRIAVFYNKIYNWMPVPLTANDQPQAPRDLDPSVTGLTTRDR